MSNPEANWFSSRKKPLWWGFIIAFAAHGITSTALITSKYARPGFQLSEQTQQWMNPTEKIFLAVTLIFGLLLLRAYGKLSIWMILLGLLALAGIFLSD
jgi:uncharacterized membrane protein